MDSSIPAELRVGPFTVGEARSLGLTWKELQARRWRRVSYGRYLWSRLPADVDLMLKTVADRLPPAAVFSGLTAAWLLGLDTRPDDPIEVTVERDMPVRARAGVKLRRAFLPAADVEIRRGYRITNALRTVRDLGSRKDVAESVVAIDMALHAQLVDIAAIERLVESNRGAKGIARLRRAVALASPRPESPMETRLRLLLVSAGLPIPDLQVDLHDDHGQFLGRADLYYPAAGLVIEFDGQNHRDRMVADARRQNALVNAGYSVLRFTAADLQNPGAVAALVSHALTDSRNIGRSSGRSPAKRAIGREIVRTIA